MVFTSQLDFLQGDFMFGSDSSLGGFQGVISDAIFYVKILNPSDMKDCFTSKSMIKDKSVYQIRKEKQVYLDTTEYFSKKKGKIVLELFVHIKRSTSKFSEKSRSREKKFYTIFTSKGKQRIRRAEKY